MSDFLEAVVKDWKRHGTSFPEIKGVNGEYRWRGKKLIERPEETYFELR